MKLKLRLKLQRLLLSEDKYKKRRRHRTHRMRAFYRKILDNNGMSKEAKDDELSLNGKEIRYVKRRRRQTHRKRTFYRKYFVEAGKESLGAENQSEAKIENQILEKNFKFDLKNDNPLLRKQARELLQFILSQNKTCYKDLSEDESEDFP